jgi:RNA polymerase sigma-70 factor (ECF subfamily)
MPLRTSDGATSGGPLGERTSEDRLDAQLMRQVQRGDREAFGALCARLTPAVDAVLVHRLPAADVPDARQEVLLRVWRHRRRYRARRGTPAALARRIALNAARDMLRKRRRTGLGVSLDAGGHLSALLTDRQPGPASLVEAADWAEHVRGSLPCILARMNPVARRAWGMRLQGLSYEEVALKLGRPVGSVATWIHRIRRELARACAMNGRQDNPSGKALEMSSQDDLAARLQRLEKQLEQALQNGSGTGLRVRLQSLADSLRRLTAGGQTNASTFRQPLAWFELYDAIEQLRPEQNRLPSGLVGRTMTAVNEARQRLLLDPQDLYAIGQLGYLARTVDRALQQAE